jgi:hypothetical protein
MASVCACALAGCGGSPDVPTGAKLVQVSSAVTGQRPTAAVTVTDPSTASRISTCINRMRPVPSGVYNCPNLDVAGKPRVTLVFRTHAKARGLAKAAETDFGFGSYACNPLIVSVPGHKNRFLIAGQFLERLQRLLGVNLGFGEGTLKGEIYLAGGPAPRSKKPLAGHVTVYLTHQLPRSGSAPISNETMPRPAQFDFSGIAPGVYFLRASVRGKPSQCPQTMVTVRVGRTTRASVPWGCGIG